MFSALIADDEPLQRKNLVKMVKQLRPKWNVYEAANGRQLLSLLDEQVRIVLTDIRMPEMDGIQAAAAIKQKFPYIKIVFVSAYDEFEYAQTAISLGISYYLLKPVLQKDLEQLIRRLEGAIEESIEQELCTKKQDNFSKATMVNHWLYHKLSAECLDQLQKRLSIPTCGKISIFKLKKNEMNETWLQKTFTEDIADYLQRESKHYIRIPIQAYPCSSGGPKIVVISSSDIEENELIHFFSGASREIYQDTMLKGKVGIGGLQVNLLLNCLR